LQQNQQERNTSISVEEYIDRQIIGYVEIINKAQGAIEALQNMKGNLVKQNGDEQKAEGTQEENGTGKTD
jgi:hypothetical protein